MALYSTLLVAHVVLTTAGYAGLIATHASMLYLSTSRNVESIRSGLTAWRRSSQTFGPILGAGVLLGFALAGVMHVPFGSRWLIITYGLIVLALGVQAAVSIPWMRRSERIAASGTLPSMAPIRFIIVLMSFVYTALLIVMIARPE